MRHRLRQLSTRVHLSSVCLAISAITLGRALQINNGFYSETALKWMTASFLLCGLGLAVHRVSEALAGKSGVLVSAILALGVGWQTVEQFFGNPGFHITADASMALFRSLTVAQGVAVAVGVMDIRILKRFWFPAFLACALSTGIWMLKASPEPFIDVVEVHREAIDALIDGRDPYRISFANIYENYEARQFYNPEALIGGRLAFAYPYPPVSLLFAVPGHVLFGDYRYSELALLIAAGALIGYTNRGLAPKLAAAVLLTTPRVWFVIEQGWTEPVSLFLLALAVFLLAREPIAAGWAIGLLAVSKQYCAFTGLAVVRMMFAARRKWMWTAFGVLFTAAAATLPFALWHPNAFMRNVIWLQTQEPFRIDSLSYLAWAARHGVGQGTFVWAVGAGTIAAVAGVLWTRNTAPGFAAAVTLAAFAFFAFGSKAFCNYYFFVIGALCCSVAALMPAPDATVSGGSNDPPVPAHPGNSGFLLRVASAFRRTQPLLVVDIGMGKSYRHNLGCSSAVAPDSSGGFV